MRLLPAGPIAQRATVAAISRSWPVFLGIALLMLGNGLQGTLLGSRATMEGFGSLVTGIVMAGYYAGFIASSFGTPRLVGRIGHVRCYAVFAASASVAVLVHGLVVNPLVWALMRALTGFCLAGVYIVSESWLNGTSRNESRGSVMSAYTMVLLLSVASGQLIVALGDPRALPLFLVASIAVSLAVLPMLLSVQPAPEPDRPQRFGLRQLARASPLGAVLAFGSGLIYGAYGGMGAAFATRLGLEIGWVSAFMAAMTIAGGAAQWPLGALSDRLPRRIVVASTSAAAAGVAIYASQIGAKSPLQLITFAALFGGLALPLYSLAIATAQDRVARDQRVAASSALILLYGAGSIAGPIVSAASIALLGDSGYFLSLAVICGGLALLALVNIGAQAADP